MTKRKYTKQRRARQEADTRQKILEATVALHGSTGPRNTTVSAIAQQAGVQRLTVYRHFPDAEALFQACTTHWLECNPPPDPMSWQRIPDPGRRTQAALEGLYAYYRETTYMWARAYRDRDEVPALQAPLSAFEAWLDGIRDDLAQSWATSPEGPLTATLGHALRFSTWQSLTAEGLDDAQSAAAIVAWVRGLSAPRSDAQGKKEQEARAVPDGSESTITSS
ncbi:TetR/AcrR family transcriptional regulator [Halomonas organivorans]